MHALTLKHFEIRYNFEMRTKKEKICPAKEIDGPNLMGGSASDVNVAGVTSSADSFYQKLCKLNESSGLSLLFNFRETRLDLYRFYKEVTERGGYHQVTKDGRWDEVVCSLNSRSNLSMSPVQLQKIYGNLLFPFEQKGTTTSGNPPVTAKSPSCFTGKRKHCKSSPESIKSFVTEQGPTAKRECNHNSLLLSTGHKSAEQKPVTEKAPEDKFIKKDPKSPLRPRTAYQIFIRHECERLRKYHGDRAGSQSIRERAVESWRQLPDSMRKPYIEESQKDKEKFIREMNAYKEVKNIPDPKPRKPPSNSKPTISSCKMLWPITDGDYHVTLQPAAENLFVPDESDIKLAILSMKNAHSNDTMLQINLDEYWSLNLPS